MISINYLFESLDTLNIKTPEELLKWMDCIEYGWMDKNHKKYTDFNAPDDPQLWWNNCVIATPEEVYKYKVGTCYEQTWFEHYFFKKWGIEHKLIHIQQYYASNHSFLSYKKNEKWMYFEHSFAKFRGIRGPFNNVNQITRLVYSFMERFEKSGKGYNSVEIDPAKLKPHMTARDFCDLVKFDYSKE